MELKQRLADELDDARRRTEELLAPVDEQRLMRQHDPLLSPLLWDYGHIGVFEELWLVNRLGGGPPEQASLLQVYDAFENPRATRGGLPLMDRATASAYRDRVRARALALLDEVELDGDDPLTRGGFVHSMIVQHEHQHDETLLQALQVLPGGYLASADLLPALPQPPAGRVVVLDDVEVAAGDYPIGSDDHEPYDNEHPQHIVHLDGYRIDRFPVTSGQYMDFVADGGYRRSGLWDGPGRAWLAESGAGAPKHWRQDGGRWITDRFGVAVEVDPRTPVVHVCWHEAQAWCRWAGRRLPTEFEWEVAATFDPTTGRRRRHPWGDEPWRPELANLDQRLLGPAPAGSYPLGASAVGCEQMAGDVWEWTASHFLPYPAYTTFPYPEYSEVFFGADYRVLRGAAWSARPSVARATFRNWDYPIRRQIFAGFRSVEDVR